MYPVAPVTVLQLAVNAPELTEVAADVVEAAKQVVVAVLAVAEAL